MQHLQQILQHGRGSCKNCAHLVLLHPETVPWGSVWSTPWLSAEAQLSSRADCPHGPKTVAAKSITLLAPPHTWKHAHEAPVVECVEAKVFQWMFLFFVIRHMSSLVFQLCHVPKLDARLELSSRQCSRSAFKTHSSAKCIHSPQPGQALHAKG